MSKNLVKLIGFSINLLSYISPSRAAKLAVLIFSKPRNAKLNEKAIQYLKGSKQEDLKHKDFNIRTYQWHGNKETILLVHGWDSNSYRWKDLIEILKQGHYNIVSVDAPAHGNTGSKIFNALLYSECINEVVLKFKPKTIIGHSVGATASAIAFKNYKMSSIDKIVLLGAPSNLGISVANYVNIMGYNNKVSKAINQYYLKYFNHLPKHYCVENYFTNIQAQGLIIHDKKDKIISFKEALDIKRANKDFELIKTIGLGHRLKSNKIYNHILDFIKA